MAPIIIGLQGCERMTNNYLRLGLLLFSSIFLLISCGPPAGGGDESVRCQPRNLIIDTIGNGRAIVAYNPGCTGTRIMRGFNFYVSTRPLAKEYPGRDLPSSIQPHNPEVYPGDPEGSARRETFEIKNIANATRYYVHMRAVYNDKSLSLPTNEIELVCYPQGEVELAISYSGEQAGFSFVKDNFCKTDALENDLYFYHKDGIDYLCSPSRLGPVNRASKIFMVAAGMVGGGLNKYRPVGPHYKRLKLKSDLRIILETEDGYNVSLHIKRIEGEGKDRRVIFEYLYKPPIKDIGSEA